MHTTAVGGDDDDDDDGAELRASCVVAVLLLLLLLTHFKLIFAALFLEFNTKNEQCCDRWKHKNIKIPLI